MFRKLLLVISLMTYLLMPIKVANADIDLLSLDSETLHRYLLDGYVAEVWWDLSNTERKELGDRIIEEWGQPFGMILKVAVEKDGEYIVDNRVKEVVCVYNALIRYSILNQPKTEEKQFYWHKEEWHSITGEGYGLPVYSVRTSSGWDEEQGEYSFDHAIVGLQIKKPFSNFDSWLFFQYKDANIQLGDWQMPEDSHIEIYELLSTDFYGDFNYEVAELLQVWDFSEAEYSTFAAWLYDRFIKEIL